MKLLRPLLLAPVLFMLAGCAANAAAGRFVEDYADARADGAIDSAEIARLDRDAAELDDSLRAAPILPPTGIPWVDLAVAATTSLAAGFGAHKYTMSVRDRLAQASAPQGTPPTA